MSHAIGMRSYLGIGFQSAHGVVADVLSAHWLPFVSESLVENVPRIDSGEIRTTFDEGYSHQGLRTTAGDITLEPTPYTLAVLGYAALGGINTTSNASYNTHVLSGLATQWSEKFALPPFTLFVGRDCGSYTITKDCAANALSLSMANGELLKATLSVLGGSLDDKGADLSDSVTYQEGAERHIPWNTTSISLAGAAIGNIISGTMGFNNNLAQIATMDTSVYPKRIKRTAKRQFTLEAQIAYEDLVHYTRLRGEAAHALSVNMHSGSNHFATLAHGAVVYTAAPMNIAGPGPVTANITMRGHKGYAMGLTCKTSITKRVGSGPVS